MKAPTVAVPEPPAAGGVRRWTGGLGKAGWVLLALLVVGIVVRAFAVASFWPIHADLDGASYANYADRDLFGDPLHPVGYSAFLAAIGFVTREVGAFGVLQHLMGIAGAVVMFAAVRRLIGSPWPALAAAAAVLLNSDLVYLEHTIMSEALFVPMLAVLLYAVVRVIEQPERWGWVVAVGVIAGLTTVVRSTGLFVLLVILAAIMLARPRPWLPRWRPPAVILGIAGAILVAYASANLAANDRLEFNPTPGWHLYARVAPFADCTQFTPPEGTEILCETSDPASRPGSEFYLVDGGSPAMRIGPIGTDDSKLGAFGRAAIIGQPKTYLNTVWDDIKRFYAPTTYPHRPNSGGDLDPQLDWTAPSFYNAAQLRNLELYMERFFDDFTVNTSPTAREVLHDYKRWLRFGGTLLSITTLLVAIGLLVGSRRSRVGVLLFGGVGLLLLFPPALSGNYVGRYVVPAAGPLVAAAAIVIWTLWHMERDRRRSPAA